MRLTTAKRGLSALLAMLITLCSASAEANQPTCEPDTDNDSLCDVWELSMFGDLSYGPDDDPDNDGMSNADEYQWGTDPQAEDTDSDGLADGLELAGDADADPATQTNPLAFDTDGDGIGDGIEDSNQNGMVDLLETDPTMIDSDGDSVDDLTEWGDASGPPRDHDQDGIPDALDPDSDNDGVPDLDEAGDSAVWTKPVDNDGDGVPDYQDDDSDNDGISDAIEAAGDSDLDGFPNPDADEDGIPNTQDLDSDNDGVQDSVEGTDDSDNDGVPNYLDPVEDSVEPPEGLDIIPQPPHTVPPRIPVPTDTENSPEPPQTAPRPLAPPIVVPTPEDNLDWDGDGLSNIAEELLGTDPRAADSDLDSIRDDVEIGSEFSPTDTDGDGFLDALDLDSDGDAIPDRWEAGAGGTTPRDTDGDGIPDFQDIDSDSDGLLDREEVTQTMTDPYRADTDGGSVPDGVEVTRGSDPHDPSDDVQATVEPAPFDPLEGTNIQGGVGACNTTSSSRGAPLSLLLLLASLGFLNRRRTHCKLKRPSIAIVLLLGIAIGVVEMPAAQAQTFDGRTIYLTADGTGVLGTPTAGTLGRFRYAAGVSSEFLQDPLVIARDGRLLQRIIGSRVDLTTHAAFGALRWLDVGLDLPSTVYSNGTSIDQQQFNTTRLGDLRIWTKAQALKFPSHGIDLGISITLGIPTGSVDEYTGAGEVTAAGDILLGGQIGAVAIHSAIGYRVLPKRTVLDLTSDDVVTFSVATRWDTGVSGISLDAAINGATSAVEPFTSASQVNLEGLIGVHWRTWRGLNLRGGVGAGMLSGPGTPVVRAYIGLSWVAPDTEVHPQEPEPEPEPEANPEPPKETPVPPADADGDGITDDVDKCPDEAEDKDFIDDEDGCPEHDRDEDGINDREDKCPDEMEDEDGYEDADGCPDSDNDRDGVADIDDKCPDTSGVASDDAEKHGCPGKVLVKLDKSMRRLTVLDESMVHFRWRTSRVPRKYRTMLKQVVAVLKAHPEVKKLRIEGHASWTGPAELNRVISQRRANMVRDKLIEFGVSPARLESIGYGFKRLKVKRRGKKYNWLNRRVEFVIIDMD